MSELAIAFPAEVAVRVAQRVIDVTTESGGLLLVLGASAVLLILCKRYATRLVNVLRAHMHA